LKNKKKYYDFFFIDDKNGTPEDGPWDKIQCVSEKPIPILPHVHVLPKIVPNEFKIIIYSKITDG
jgi:hypothetical protein